MNQKEARATAIVPSYNEKLRIGAVISALLSARLVNEIIVIDDGSIDSTAEFVSQTFPSVLLFRNDRNRGKAFCMDYGVEKASNNIILFCDADLAGFTGEMADQIVQPIIEGKYDMFIGVRNNKMQKLFIPFAINSGERAISKELWGKLPPFYKHRFRIEVGLNYLVSYATEKGMGYKIMPYYQTLKEKNTDSGWGSVSVLE